MQNLFLKILEEARYNSTKNKLKRNINAAIMTIHIKNPQEIENRALPLKKLTNFVMIIW
jgi:hypothetical protein